MTNIDLYLYLLKSSICFSLLYLGYRFIFSKTTFFQLNRLYLLSILPLSVLVPLIKLSEQTVQRNFYALIPEITINNTTTIGNNTNWLNASYFFWAITSVFFIHYLIKIIGLGIKITRLKKGQEQNTAPFSFFNYIHIPEKLDLQNKALIVAHEQVHVHQGHSFDVVVYELYKAVFWFNPLAWLAVNDVKINHEFIADHLAAKKEITHYSNVLVAQLLGVNCSDLVNNFNTQPLIYKRIKMMKTKKTNKFMAISYSVIVPILAMTILGTGSIQVNAQTAASASAKTSSNTQKQGTTSTKKKTTDTVDQMPEFKGGTEKLIAYLGAEIHYPESSKKANEQGTVFISFVIDEKGKVTQPAVEKGVTDSLDAEALRVVSAMPDWVPGKDKNQLVSVKMVLPIKFQL